MGMWRVAEIARRFAILSEKDFRLLLHFIQGRMYLHFPLMHRLKSKFREGSRESF